MTWPRLNTLFEKGISQQAIKLKEDNTALVASAEAVAAIETEAIGCDTYDGYPPDMGVFDELHLYVERHIIPAWNELLVNLAWRTFRQAVAWSMFSHLLKKGLVSLDCLKAPISLYQKPRDAKAVLSLFSCFPLIRRFFRQVFKMNIPLQSASYDDDIHWYVSSCLAMALTNNMTIQAVNRNLSSRGRSLPASRRNQA